MTEYVIQLSEKEKGSTGESSPKYLQAHYYHKIASYATLLQRKLELSMFIPCDSKGEPMEEPTDMYQGDQYYGALMDEYQKALATCIFEGGEIKTENEHIFGDVTGLYIGGKKIAVKNKTGWIFNPKYKTIEDLLNAGVELKPTKNLISQL